MFARGRQLNYPIKQIWLLLLLILLLLLVPMRGFPLEIPGYANPWLAGVPDGSVSGDGDSAPGNSPILFSAVNPGTSISLTASGAVSNEAIYPLRGPDGDVANPLSHEAGSEFGISDVIAPLSALVGVFLADTAPHAGGGQTPAKLDFGTAEARDYLIIRPQLKQVFFIGDGLTSTGKKQSIIAPSGARRLFLGVMDGCCWGDNPGSFNAELAGFVFSHFSPQAQINFGPGANHDFFEATAKLSLGSGSDGIDPRGEDLTFGLGAFSVSVPAGSFRTYSQHVVPEKVRFSGTVQGVRLLVDIYSYGSNRYLVWVKGSGAKLGGTSVPIKVSLRIGNDYGDAALAIGKASFKKVMVKADGETCKSIKAERPEAKVGAYTIDPDGSGGNEPVEVYCDMVTAGGGWEVLFRGDDPGKWATTFGTPGKGQWGIDKTGLPSSISELRFSRVDTGEGLSIPMAAADVYGCAPAGSNYFWNGMSYENFSARHLGVSDNVPLTGPPEFEGYVITGEPCNNDHHSWGFGHRGWIDDRQAWGWDSQDLGPTVFQIQVR